MANNQTNNLNTYRDECHHASVARGWWIMPITDTVHKAAVKIALIHSEVSEALEGIRKSQFDAHLPHRQAGEVELADALIRIFDLAGFMKYDLEAAYREKRAYNEIRADHNPENRGRPDGKQF
jgi:NTP pyrophosphatase (non-canonical NTP hydrolase)